MIRWKAEELADAIERVIDARLRIPHAPNSLAAYDEVKDALVRELVQIAEDPNAA